MCWERRAKDQSGSKKGPKRGTKEPKRNRDPGTQQTMGWCRTAFACSTPFPELASQPSLQGGSSGSSGRQAEGTGQLSSKYLTAHISHSADRRPFRYSDPHSSARGHASDRPGPSVGYGGGSLNFPTVTASGSVQWMQHGASPEAPDLTHLKCCSLLSHFGDVPHPGNSMAGR